MNCHDTIAAIATPIGSAGIGVIRISGPEAFPIVSRMFGGDASNSTLFPTHTAHHGRLTDPVSGEVIDDVVLTVFRAPRSYTGEDVAEVSCHGSYAVLKAALSAILGCGARLADPGEFTRRAFLNGKLDLAQAEAVNDLIRSRTDGARRVALSQLDGALSDKLRLVNDRILGVVAAVEAAIDFPEDVPEPDWDWVRDEILAARESADALLASFVRGRVYREGLRMVIAGNVNVGKSSLMNALLRHARSIVTPVPGTTRDVIEENLEIQGIPIVAIDTAGLRTTEDEVERIGVELTRRSLVSADLVLLVLDACEPVADLSLLPDGARVIVVVNKIDLLSDGKAELVEIPAELQANTVVSTSAASGIGIEALEDAVARVATESGASSESALVSNARHQQALQAACDSLTRALQTASDTSMIDLLSVDLAAARNSIGSITGETATEDLLDRIFSEFCIGK